MHVYIASTSQDLAAHGAAAWEVAAALGFEPLVAQPHGRAAGRDAVTACARRIARCDMVLAIVGWRRGPVPGPELGGDGRRSWVEWEVRSAIRQAKPVVVLRADDSWPSDERERDAIARAGVADFRGELDRLAVPFAAEPPPLTEFRARLERELDRSRRMWARPPAAQRGPALHLRRWPPPELPERPYPLLLPYAHPDLLGGRRRELRVLLRLLAEPVPILGLYAPSGAGKSSLLGGGLVPWLRAAGHPASFERHPAEPGLARRLLGDLLTPAGDVADDDHRTFANRLLAVARLAGRPPVLVVDQFEDLLRGGESRARAVAGTLLAASVQRQPGYNVAPCRWLLAYRQEFHGAVCGWLADVLREVPGAGLGGAPELPHDLSGPERFHAWALPPLGTPSAAAEDRAGEAARAFQEAIETPLALFDDHGRRRYPWRFAADGAARLARSFGEARMTRPDAPLTPELQVVLARLLERAGRATAGAVMDVDVPVDAAELIDSALEEHLRRALDVAFPLGRKADTTIGRTRALLALRELADAHGRRGEGRPAAALARAIGRDGRDVLERLATPPTRIVLLERHGDAGGPDPWVYVLSHDRMAEVVARLVDDEGTYAGLGVDAELLGLRRFVVLQRELFAAGEVEQATEVPKDIYRAVERHAEALLWDDEGRLWWAMCGEKRRRDRRRAVIRRAAAAAALALLTVAVWIWASRFFERQALLDQIVSGDPEAAFEALALLSADSAFDPEELLDRVRQRERPFDVLDRGLGGVDEEHRGSASLRVADLLLLLVHEEPEDPVRIASTVWALDFFAAPDPTLRDRAIALRDEVLRELRYRRPPPPLPGPGDPEWADLPAGTFQMGSDFLDERPKHSVRLSEFRLMVHEVTRAEFRRLYPDVGGAARPGYEDLPVFMMTWHEALDVGGAARPGDEDLPVVMMTWYEAYTYAAWLGGRLPTEAELEYAARAGCSYAYCKRDGSEATLSEVAWWAGNSADPKTGELSLHPVMKREPTLWGLYDVYGNANEATADWFSMYSAEHQTDPAGPTASTENIRTARGADFIQPEEWVVGTVRFLFRPEGRYRRCGLRVALPSVLYRTDSAADDESESKIYRPESGATGSTTR